MNKILIRNHNRSNSFRWACAVLLLVIWFDGGSGIFWEAIGSETAAAAESKPGGNPPAQPSTHTLLSIDTRAKNMNFQVRALQASVKQSVWNSGLQANNVSSLRTALAGLRQDVTTFQDNNRAANFQDAVRISNDFQQQLNQVAAGLDNLAGARDAASAQGALSQISIRLDTILNTIDTLPPCCTEGICCHVGFR